MSPLLTELFIFTYKQLLACKFAISFFILLLISHFYTFGFPRYDFLFLSMILVQIIFVTLKIESLDELKVIFAFHLIGVGLELFKTHPSIGAWSYPESGFFKIYTVPFYSGFMYSAVASYIIQSWKIFSLKTKNYPQMFLTIPFAFAIYMHYFLKHYGFDMKWGLILTVFIIYFRTSIFFTVQKKTRSMPLALSFGLVSFFLWVAENISTFLGAWKYPNQAQSWSLVYDSKMYAWFLLFIVSFIVVVDLKILREKKKVKVVSKKKARVKSMHRS